MALPQTFFYFNDATGTTWQVSVSDAGQLSTLAVAARAPNLILLNDFQLATTSYQLGVTTAGLGVVTAAGLVVPTASGELTAALVPFAGYPLSQVLVSPSGSTFLIQVISGALQTTPLVLAGALPKVVYPSASIGVVAGLPSGTLNFLRQPRFVPAFYLNAVRHDTLSTAGVRQSILERIENFFEFEMEWVALIADVAAWKQFMSYALAGGAFDYYADGTKTTFTTFLLEDTKWIPRYKVPGEYTFKALFRQQVT